MDVVVIGSLNRDISVLTPQLPKPGESVTGTEHFFGPGGKGANQAVAAARLGAAVAMVGRVGDDEHGVALRAGLDEVGVDTTAIGVDPAATTGLAVITIDDRAENTIVVSPGANLTLTPAHIAEHAEMIASASVVLAQLEIPIETVARAAQLSTGVFCLNPAPARPLPAGLHERVDILLPNRSELGALAQSNEPKTVAEAVELARSLRHRKTIVTLGADGAVLVDDDGFSLIPAPRVNPIDPTGAGDAFCGAFAYFLSRGAPLEGAARAAVAAGAAAVTMRGAQTAMPTLDMVETLIAG